VNKLLRFGVTGLLLYWVGSRTDWEKVRVAFAGLDVRYWLGAVGVLIAAQVVSAARWRIFARQLGLERSLAQLTGFYFIGMYFNLLLPTSVGGDVVRAWYLNGGSGKKLRSVAAVLLDRINGVIVLVLVACTAAFLAPPELPAWIRWSAYGCLAAGVCGVMGIAAIAWLGLLPGNRREQLGMMWEIVRTPQALIATSFYSLIVQIASVLIAWLVGEGLGASIPLAYYAVFVPMVSLLTMLPISINGVGLREEGTKLFLAPVGVSAEMAVILALLWFAVQLAVSILGGLVYLFGHFPKPQTAEKEGDDGSVDGDSDQGREGQLTRAA
jgi:uncharacterized membrane protein YbhN (UPF0104 family)